MMTISNRGNEKMMVIMTRFGVALGCLIGVLFVPREAQAQNERTDIRQGNRAFHQGKYPEAEVGYKRAIEKNINSYEANYNLGGALYKQERYDDAVATYEKLVQDGSDIQKQAATYYNMGNTLLKQRKLDEAIEAYKSSLRLVPKDEETKFNLAYAKKLKEEEEKQDNQDNEDNQDNKDNQDDNQDQNKDQDDKDKDKGEDEQDKDQDGEDEQDKDEDEKDKGKDKDGQQPPPEQSPQPKEESERMLKAIQASEDNTKKKVDAEAAAAAATRGGNQW